MAVTEQKPAAAKAAPKMVKVKVLRGVNCGGMYIRPRQVGEGRFEPVEAYLPESEAASFGPKYVQVLGEAPAGAKIGPVAAR